MFLDKSDKMKRVKTKREKWFMISQMGLGLLLIVTGMIFIFKDRILPNISYAFFLVILIYGFFVLVYRYYLKRKWIDLLFSLIGLILIIFVLVRPEIFIEFFAFMFGIWALFKAVTLAFDLYVAIIKKQKGKIYISLEFILNLFMGILLIKSGIDNFFLVNLQVGIYVMMQGFFQMLSTYRVVRHDGYQIRLPAPIILTAFFPLYLLKKVDKDSIEDPSIVKEKAEATTGDYISMYLYAKDHGYNRMGHIDLGYNGAIYSYGCHDPFDRHSTQAYGGGVLIVGSETDYVQYCVDDDTTVFRFLCKITSEQREEIEKSIANLMKDAYFYDYPMEREGAKDNYLGFLKMADVSVDYYKFNSGPFKTYNVFTTNCIMVSEEILRSTGMRLFHMNGLITPGTYYSYLNRNLNQPGSVVIKKEVYRRHDVRNKHKVED